MMRSSYPLKTLAALLCCLGATCIAQAQNYGMYQKEGRIDPKALGAEIAIEQRVGVPVDLDLTFRDEQGHAITLHDCVANKPTVLVMAYYRCPQLCNVVLTDLVTSLRQMDRFDVGQEFQVVTVSIDPKETHLLARDKKQSYVNEYGRSGAAAGWHFLTGSKETIDTLCQQVGFKYVYDKGNKQYYHSAGIVLLTPEGKVSRYLLGLNYKPNDLRLGLVDASEGEIGSVVDAILLRCYHYDPKSGTYKPVMNVLSVAGAITVAVLAVVLWRAWRAARREALTAASAGDMAS